MRISDWSSDVCSSDLSNKRFQRGNENAGIAPAFLLRPDQAYLIRKSSRLRPLPVYAASQRGCLPRPVQVLSGLDGSRYFGATLPSDLRAFLAVPRGARVAVAVPPPVPNSSAMV